MHHFMDGSPPLRESRYTVVITVPIARSAVRVPGTKQYQVTRLTCSWVPTLCTWTVLRFDPSWGPVCSCWCSVLKARSVQLLQHQCHQPTGQGCLNACSTLRVVAALSAVLVRRPWLAKTHGQTVDTVGQCVSIALASSFHFLHTASRGVLPNNMSCDAMIP